jgi:FKBP-type peptidyl-prolyl cis-trans isomerase SlyD
MAEDITIADGQVVLIHYTLSLEDGNAVDSSRDGEPLGYIHGAGHIVPGLERQLIGKAVGARFTAQVPAEEGYGERVGPDPQPVPREQFPEDIEIVQGMMFEAEDDGGNPLPIWVAGVTDGQVLVDTNHPLAGMSLTFDVEVMDVREATEEEVSHGHVHGPGGHHH